MREDVKKEIIIELNDLPIEDDPSEMGIRQTAGVFLEAQIN